MRIKKQELGYYTDLYKLEGAENRKERLIAYNNILFKSLDELTNGEKQIIVINEVGNGGCIYGTIAHADKALRNLKKALKGKYIEVIDIAMTKVYKKISFGIRDEWQIKL